MKFVDFMADSREFYTGLIDPVCKKYGLTQMEFNLHVCPLIGRARTAHRGILWDGPEDDPSETYRRCCADGL